MNTTEYLKKVLASQTLADGSDELKALQQHRVDVERLLRAHFCDCSPTIRYGGSKAKGTMIKASYDLDLICYFPHDDTGAGETLEDIYNNTKTALQESYLVEPKTSALRLKDADASRSGIDFHIDVVPGRFTDDTKSDTFLYCAGGEKKRLKTNIDTHVSHVRDSGVIDAIRLIKLWKVLNGIMLKNFVLELVVIELLKNRKTSSLSAQLEYVWTEFRDHSADLVVEDPANPDGNDLSGVLDAAKDSLASVAQRTILLVESSGWDAVFGAVAEDSNVEKAARLRAVAAAVATPSRPWSTDAP